MHAQLAKFILPATSRCCPIFSVQFRQCCRLQLPCLCLRRFLRIFCILFARTNAIQHVSSEVYKYQCGMIVKRRWVILAAAFVSTLVRAAVRPVSVDSCGGYTCLKSSSTALRKQTYSWLPKSLEQHRAITQCHRLNVQASVRRFQCIFI